MCELRATTSALAGLFVFSLKAMSWPAAASWLLLILALQTFRRSTAAGCKAEICAALDAGVLSDACSRLRAIAKSFLSRTCLPARRLGL
jgi:hypothetical protein